MASQLGPNGQQRRYFNGTNSNASSTTNLLPPSARSRSPGQQQQAVQAALARGPQQIRPQPSTSSFNESPYGSQNGQPGRTASITPSISDKFSLSPDPLSWGANLSQNEPDDYLHNPDPKRDRKNDKGGTVFTPRGLANLGCLAILAIGLVTLFAGYPVITYFTRHPLSSLGGFNIGGTNDTGQVPSMPGNWGLIDLDTPKSAYTTPSFSDGSQWQLVFSDEFNTDGRSFYPGDDPYWEAVDLHYWQTNNLEWYDPAAVTTSGGAMKITLSKQSTHGLNYQGGLVSTWNKFCFTGGMLLASVTIPGAANVVGLWPAIWAMGNLGRAGYGASLEGMWPYSYDSCDVGTVANQTVNGLPITATVGGDQAAGGVLSFLPGQRLSRCTCPGESHPGPQHADGTYVGRAAPEIDVFEAQIADGIGYVSQSSQWGPFNEGYAFFNQSPNLVIQDPTVTTMNFYTGGAFQQAISAVSETNQGCYEIGGTACFATYGFEYKPGFDNAYISWINDGKLMWTMTAAGVAADPRVEIGPRPIAQEPMYIIMNLGMSVNFGSVDFEHLVFPTTMSIDWVRVYQPSNAINIGCDPPDFPTAAYINQYIGAYSNPNFTTWRDDFGQPFPKNSFLGTC